MWPIFALSQPAGMTRRIIFEESWPRVCSWADQDDLLGAPYGREACRDWKNYDHNSTLALDHEKDHCFDYVPHKYTLSYPRDDSHDRCSFRYDDVGVAPTTPLLLLDLHDNLNVATHTMLKNATTAIVTGQSCADLKWRPRVSDVLDSSCGPITRVAYCQCPIPCVSTLAHNYTIFTLKNSIYTPHNFPENGLYGNLTDADCAKLPTIHPSLANAWPASTGLVAAPYLPLWLGNFPQLPGGVRHAAEVTIFMNTASTLIAIGLKQGDPLEVSWLGGYFSYRDNVVIKACLCKPN